MADQWFLDLDGVRSGPYQTPEVMALVAEGEVLPHHRISRGLKDQKWVSILDWRLEQAKTSASSTLPLNSPPSSEVIQSLTPDEPIEEAPAQALEPEPVPPSDMVEEAPPRPQEPPPLLQKLQKVEEIAQKDPSSPRRDPTAEMFEMLQNTRQRREKQTKIPGVTVEPDVGSTGSSPVFKVVFGGVGIIFLGFGLGQLFQSSKPPAAPPVVEVKVSPTLPPRPERKVEVIDRSTDKMTIRAKVERTVEAAPIATPQPKNTPQPVQKSALQADSETGNSPVEKRVNEKEMEELKDLKRELQELKALKEQINTQEYPPGEGAPEGAPLDQDEFAPITPFGPGGEAGTPAADSQVHY